MLQDSNGQVALLSIIVSNCLAIAIHLLLFLPFSFPPCLLPAILDNLLGCDRDSCIVLCAAASTPLEHPERDTSEMPKTMYGALANTVIPDFAGTEP